MSESDDVIAIDESPPADVSPEGLAAAKKRADEQLHYDRLKAEHEHTLSQVGKLFVGQREIEIVGRAGLDDPGYVSDAAVSKIRFVDTGEIDHVRDSSIQAKARYIHQ
jgi:hypothetical protein